jgi:hypothetical protein
MPRIALPGRARLDVCLPALLFLLVVLPGVPVQGQGSPARSVASQPPNILLIVCDDMGWRDLSCFGNLEADPREQTNRLADQPEVAEALRKELTIWLAEPRRKYGQAD